MSKNTKTQPSKHPVPNKGNRASITKHAQVLGQLGGKSTQEASKHANNLQNYTKINTMLRMK